MQSVISHLRQGMGVTLVSLVLLQGTTTHFGPLYLNCVHKAEGMTIYVPMDMTGHNALICCSGTSVSFNVNDSS